MDGFNQWREESCARYQFIFGRNEAIRCHPMFLCLPQRLESFDKNLGAKLDEVLVPVRRVVNGFAVGSQQEIGIDEKRESGAHFRWQKSKDPPIALVVAGER